MKERTKEQIKSVKIKKATVNEKNDERKNDRKNRISLLNDASICSQIQTLSAENNLG